MTQLYRDLAGVERLIHEPGRLDIMAVLCVYESADFLSILHTTGLSRGNLSRHLAKLEEAGYVHIGKTFQRKVPRTVCSLTEAGRDAFQRYRVQLERAISSLPHAVVHDPRHG